MRSSPVTMGLRCVLALGAFAAILVALTGCDGDGQRLFESDDGAAARLQARPQPDLRRKRLPEPGLHPLPIDRGPAPLLFVPRAATSAAPAPLVLALPGAGNDLPKLIDALRPHAEAAGALVLAVGFRSGGWDVLREGFGRDVRVIDSMLERIFRRAAVDPARVGVAGYSDGASYAISLALANGGLLRHVSAFSPGFVAEAPRSGQPRVRITHGTDDPVLPIDATSHEIVPRLRDAGVQVELRTFAGGHKIPHPLLPWALGWLKPTG